MVIQFLLSVPLLYKEIEDCSKPQWEWLLIPSLITENGDKVSARIWRYHHTYMDGIYGGIFLGENVFQWGTEDNSVPYIFDPRGPKWNTFSPPWWAYLGTLLWAPSQLPGILCGPPKNMNTTLTTHDYRYIYRTYI